jgi:hypothetical protein
MDKHAGLPRRRVPWPPGVVSPVAPAGNNARAAVPEGPSESLTMSGLRLRHAEVGELGLFSLGLPVVVTR